MMDANTAAASTKEEDQVAVCMQLRKQESGGGRGLERSYFMVAQAWS